MKCLTRTSTSLITLMKRARANWHLIMLCELPTRPGDAMQRRSPNNSIGLPSEGHCKPPRVHGIESPKGSAM